MTPPTHSILPHSLITIVSWFMAAEFLFLAPMKFSPRGIGKWPSYPEKFRSWGFPPWFSFIVGAGEILAAVMLLLPSHRFFGAVILVITMVGGMVTHQINHDKLTDSIAAPIHFVLATLVALSTWPTDWTEPLSFDASRPQHAYTVVIPHSSGDVLEQGRLLPKT